MSNFGEFPFHNLSLDLFILKNVTNEFRASITTYYKLFKQSAKKTSSLNSQFSDSISVSLQYHILTLLTMFHF